MLLCSMLTIKDVFEDYKKLHNIYDADEIRAITSLSINSITSLSTAYIKAFADEELSNDHLALLTSTLQKLLTGMPIQYALSVTEFYGLPFLVNPSVLIPRPETEELVSWIIINNKNLKSANPTTKILDIGTGSGCIAISLKKNLPLTQVLAMDISEEALKTALKNAELNGVDVSFLKADILTLQPDANNSGFSIIVSNPPYVTLEDKKQMHQNVTGFEPHTALFVPENDPLIFYKAIANFALVELIAGGTLFFEINESFGKETADLLKEKGFIDIELKQDMSGKDRMIAASLPSKIN